jgi:thioesterase domain-containing protein
VYDVLGKMLGQEQPFYAIQPRGFNGKSDPFISMEAMASDFIKLIQQEDPQGPYCLGGYSFGGPVAYEMASQLQKKGFAVSQLIILDSLSPCNKAICKNDIAYEQWLCSSVEMYEKYYGININISVSELTGHTKEQQLDIVTGKLKGIGMEISAEQLNGVFNVTLSNVALLDKYQPDVTTKVNVPTTIFKCNAPDPERLSLYGEQPFLKEDLGWKDLISGPLTVYNIPGNHHSFLFAPNVETVAGLIKSVL